MSNDARGFPDRLCEAVRQKRTAVMVGLDPRWDELPDDVRRRAVDRHGETLDAVAEAYRDFCEGILAVVADVAPIVKFQAAFFEAAGPAGMQTLATLVDTARQAGLLVVLDGKRNDIGTTAEAYSNAYLGEVRIGQTSVRPWPCDALTVNPYLGSEGIAPFLDAAEKHRTGLFVLVRTSNPGAGKLQDLIVNGPTIYQIIAEWVENWSIAHVGESGYGPVGAVVGATVPSQLAELRFRMPHSILLVPGYGAQGGSAADVASAFDTDGLGAVVNNSRGILFAFRKPQFAGKSWQDAARSATQAMIEDLARHTPARQLVKKG